MGEDRELVDRYLSGDSKALGELVAGHQRQVYALAYRMTGDVEEAKEITQEVFMKMVEHVRQFRKESLFSTWLYRITVNACLNHRRKRRRGDTPYEEVQPGAGSSLADGPCHVLSAVEHNEACRQVRESLRDLPERQRAAIILRTYHGLNIAESARIMECSEGAVKAHYHNGIKRLREKLREKGYGTEA